MSAVPFTLISRTLHMLELKCLSSAQMATTCFNVAVSQTSAAVTTCDDFVIPM